MNSSKLQQKGICALWFGVSASLLAVPNGIARYNTVALEPVYVAVMEGVVPVLIAVLVASFNERKFFIEPSDVGSFTFFKIGMRISVLSAVIWFVVAIIGGLVYSEDVSRLTSSVGVLAVMGFPIYGILAGISGIFLRKFVLVGYNKN